MSETEPDFEALSGAADSVRRLIAHIRKTRAPEALLQEVALDLAGVAEKLAPWDHPGPYAQRRLVVREEFEGLERDTDIPGEFFPYSPAVGPLNPIAPPVDFQLVGSELQAEHVFDAPYNGPPTAVHGGVIALVFDELLGTLGAMLGIGGFTGTLQVVYRSLTPLHQPIRMRSWVDREEGVKVFIKGTMQTGEGEHERLCAEAEGIFIRPKVSMLQDAVARAKADAD